ncbi:flavoprotein [Mucisphaera sp.]|uniref:flavoprotein n=1 Tax=Mucisphaera sp. TaxID=2913024 RepID=UPI003D102FBE
MADGEPTEPGRAEVGSLSAVAGRSVLVGVTGGIAAYKVAGMVSMLVKAGAEVRVLMTESATRFVGPTTFASLSGKRVLASIWDTDDRPDSQHVAVARDADVMVIAPATANCLGKLSAGLCDDVVTLAATALPKGRPLVVAPAMNADMWASPMVQRNVRLLGEMLSDLVMVGPGSGWQACRTEGAGRMAEADEIAAVVASVLKG